MEQTLKILVVDDDEVDRITVRRALTTAGVRMQLFEVANSNDALSAFEHTTYDCVFLD